MKAIFYYIADERVDFRELIKIFAEQFRIRIEMKQIGARQEAGRIGGIGSCGRELCCSTWMSGFVSVTTNSARFQEISLNPQKLAGQCGKLKCCLNYEVDTYIDARREFPRINAPLETLEGNYYLVKSDIFKKQLSFSSDPNNAVNIVTVPLGRVREIMSMNRRGVKPDTLQSAQDMSAKEEQPDFKNVVGEESITRFDGGKSQSRRDGRRGGRSGRQGDGDRRRGDNDRRRGDGDKTVQRNEQRPKEESSRADDRGRRGRRRPDERTAGRGENTQPREGGQRQEPRGGQSQGRQGSRRRRPGGGNGGAAGGATGGGND